MSIFSKLFRKGQVKEEPQDEQLDEIQVDVYGVNGEENFHREDDEENNDTEEWAVASVNPTTQEEAVDINYRGGLLSPTQKPKEEQYREILDNITEETIGVIDKALKEEVQLYDVFRRIEEQNISLLTLVALDMTSEEDIAAYQLKQQRQYEETGVLEDADYENEVAQAQVEQPNVQFQIDSEELAQLDKDVSSKVMPSSELLSVSSRFESPVVEPPVSTPAGEDAPVVGSIFSGSIFGAHKEDVAEVTPTEPTKVDQGHAFFPKGNPSTNKMMDALMSVDKKVETTHISLPAARFMADMQPADEPTPVVETVVEPVIEPTPVVEAVVEPVIEPTPVVEAVVEPVIEPTPVAETVVKPVIEPTPVAETATTPSFMQAMEEVVDEVKATDTEDVPQDKAGTFAGVNMEFEGYEVKSNDGDANSPHDVLDGLRALFSAPPNGSTHTRKPKITAPSLSAEKVQEKAQQIQKYTRKNTIKDTRIYILWEGLTLPKIEGYQFIAVKTLRDLSSFGLDLNDLLIVTSQLPKGFVDSIDAYLHNIREEQQPYRIVNFSKKPYDTPYISASLNALTKEALDEYFENNQIVLDKKNQVSGFSGIADFLTKKGEGKQ